MYLDPGFGSMVIQLVIAAFAACGAAFYMMKSKLKKKFGKNKQADGDTAEGAEVQADAAASAQAEAPNTAEENEVQ